MKNLIKGTYASEDCVYLLQDMQDLVTPVTQSEKKQQMLSGKKSYEMIPYEYKVDEVSERTFLRMVEENCESVARYTGILSESIYKVKGRQVVLVSLARGGVPVGVLCKRYFKKIYGINVPHYVISLIRNEGIDIAALRYIEQHHPDSYIQFIDGWTGMGFISSQLEKYVAEYNELYKRNVDPSLGVLVDSSKICQYYGTRDDVVFPCCCLNATVCGMISSIFYDRSVIDHNSFHGALQWNEEIGIDYSNFFVNKVSSYLKKQSSVMAPIEENYAARCLSVVQTDFNVNEKKNIKFGIGESTRAIIRYDLRCLLIKDESNPNLQFILELAKKRNIKVMKYTKTDYECIALISDKEVF